MPGPHSNISYAHDRYSHHAEPTNSMRSYPGRQVPSRPDFARAQTMPRGPLPGPPHGPMYPDRPPPERAYPPHHAPHPTYTRQHHSFYDERAPLPPPPLQYRHAQHEEPYYAYGARSPTSTASAQLHQVPFAYDHHTQPKHSSHLPTHARHPYGSHYASLSSTGSSASSSPQAMRAPVSHSLSMSVGSQQQPTYRGHIKTTKDAILLLAACDLVDNAGTPGLPPPRRVKRRLLDSERADVICSGSIFVWDEKEAGMRRWTDGKCWSASRVSGCFLTYRELEARKKPSSSITGGPTSNLYKAEGLIKQSFSMTTTSGRKLHVISYYTKRDVREGLLRRVSEDPRFVGENGGEWGLHVDEAEYPDPISRAGELPPGVNPQDPEGSQSPPSPAHLEPARGSTITHPRNIGYEPRRVSPAPKSYVDERAHGERSRLSPDPREPCSLSPCESASRHELVSHEPHYRPIKKEPLDRLSYPADVTPLHEARGLLPIRPIPVDSKYAEFALRGSSKHVVREISPCSGHDAGHAYGRKRSYQEFRGTASSFDEGRDDVKPACPRTQRMRSWSASSPDTTVQDVLAPIRPLGRVGSDDEAIPQLRTTHVMPPLGFKDQHDSAVGALLSLRSGSGSSDDSGSLPMHSKKVGAASSLSHSPTSTAPSSAAADDVSAKPGFSRMDRAALDRFSVRI